jgi:hypothetical protein
MQATGSMDCDGNVSVHITNDGTLTFIGQSATASSWIVNVTLLPGQDTTIGAKFSSQKSVEGYVSGRLSDGTRVSTGWTATRACEVTTTTTAPVDTTPHPVTIGSTIVCIVPGSPTQEPVPCDDPRATTPYTPPTTATTAPAAPGEPEAPPVAPTTKATTQGRTGPPRTQAIVAETRPIKSLPVTASNDGPLAIIGSGALAIGLCMVWLTRRRDGV